VPYPPSSDVVTIGIDKGVFDKGVTIGVVFDPQSEVPAGHSERLLLVPLSKALQFSQIESFRFM